MPRLPGTGSDLPALVPQYPCLVCGKPSPGSYCPQHLRQQNQDVRTSRAWRRLSEEVRAAEPHCRDCKAKGVVKLATQVHHTASRGSGGALLPPKSELVPLCTAHHNQRRAEEPVVTKQGPKRSADWPLIA